MDIGTVGKKEEGLGNAGPCSGWFARVGSSFGIPLVGRIQSAAEYSTLIEALVSLESSHVRESSHFTGLMKWKLESQVNMCKDKISGETVARNYL